MPRRGHENKLDRASILLRCDGDRTYKHETLSSMVAFMRNSRMSCNQSLDFLAGMNYLKKRLY